MAETMYRSIVLPLDGSPFAEQAIPLALEIANRAGAMVQVALVHHAVPALATALEVPEIESQLDQEARAREQVYLSGVIDRMRRTANVPVTSALLDGAVTEALAEHIETTGADLVVITTHGRGPLRRFWLGSVADHLMRSLHLPVLIVHPASEPAAPRPVRRVLIALDGSPFSERAIPPAVALGKPFGAEFTLAMVVEPPLPITDPSGILLVPVAAGTEKQLKEASLKYLTGVADGMRASGLVVTTRQIDAAAAADALLAEAEACQADVIALASHGAGGFERMVVGSIADKVVRGSTRPTLIVRPVKGDD